MSNTVNITIDTHTPGIGKGIARMLRDMFHASSSDDTNFTLSLQSEHALAMLREELEIIANPCSVTYTADQGKSVEFKITEQKAELAHS